jgi:hypothetical protein
MMVAPRLVVLMLLFSHAAFAGNHYGYPRRRYDPSEHYKNGPSAVETVAAIGCLAAIGYGIYKFCDWLFTPSDEKVLQRGIDELQYAHLHYDGAIGFMEFHYSAIPDNVRDQKRLIQSVNEAVLYDYAISYKKDTSINGILTNMGSVISSLQSAHTSLAERIKKLRNNDGNQSMITNMQQVDQEIIGLLCKLEFVHEYFSHHRSYYHLFDLEARLLHAYEFELNAINQSQMNPVYVREAVRASVMRQASARTGYAYMHYVDRAQADCNALGGALGSLPYNYANRIGAAGVLLHNLKVIHTIVVAEDAYHQEVLAYKKEQLEKERINAERAKAAAAAAQAAAMQHQAWEMQKQNQLHAQQIRVDSERNAIMATQTIVNALNPPQPQVNVYV